MADNQFVKSLSPNLKKAVCWISETVREFPAKNREEIITEAELRFDLSPRECEFITNNFNEIPDKCNNHPA